MSLMSLVMAATLITAPGIPLGVSQPHLAAQPLCLEGTVWDAERQDCVPIEESAAPQPSLDPTVEPSVMPSPQEPSRDPAPSEIPLPPTESPNHTTPSANAEPSGGSEQLPPGAEFIDIPEYGDPAVLVFASFYSCQEGPDWYAFADANWYAESQLCLQPSPPDLPLNVWVDGDLIAMTDTSIMPGYSDGGLMAQVQPLPAGDLRIVSQPPRGFGTPIVYCSVWTASGVEPSMRPLRRNQQYHATRDGAITIRDIQLNEWVTCQWNNVPTDENASVTVNGYQCPAGYDPYGVAPTTLRLDCPRVTDGREFLLAGPNDVTRQGHANQMGYVEFEDVLPGVMTITGLQPGGSEAPLVYCEMTGPNGQTLSGYDYQIPASNDSIAYTVEPMSDLRCDWFFTAGDQNSGVGPAASPSGNSPLGIPPVVRPSASPSR
jgi:hypothetical protein